MSMVIRTHTVPDLQPGQEFSLACHHIDICTIDHDCWQRLCIANQLHGGRRDLREVVCLPACSSCKCIQLVYD